jgi:hypothetical protein
VFVLAKNQTASQTFQLPEISDWRGETQTGLLINCLLGSWRVHQYHTI